MSDLQNMGLNVCLCPLLESTAYFKIVSWCVWLHHSIMMMCHHSATMRAKTPPPPTSCDQPTHHCHNHTVPAVRNSSTSTHTNKHQQPPYAWWLLLIRQAPPLQIQHHPDQTSHTVHCTIWNNPGLSPRQRQLCTHHADCQPSLFSSDSLSLDEPLAYSNRNSRHTNAEGAVALAGQLPCPTSSNTITQHTLTQPHAVTGAATSLLAGYRDSPRGCCNLVWMMPQYHQQH